MYTLFFQKYLMFFALTWTDFNWIYIFHISTNHLKNGGLKRISPNNLDSCDTSRLCNLPSLSSATWPTFSCFKVLTHIYLARSYRGLRHHMCPKVFVTVLITVTAAAAKVSAKKRCACTYPSCANSRHLTAKATSLWLS